MEQKCPACGADNLESARYCRKCGIQIGNSQFTEAPTRSFEDQRLPVADHMSSSAPGMQQAPRYMPPGPVQQPTGYQPHPGVTGIPQRINTAPIATGPVPRKGPNWLLIIGGVFLTVIMVFAMLIAGVVSAIKSKIERAESDKPTATKQSDDDGGVGFTLGGTTDPDKLPAKMKEWYYDGADIKFTASGSMGGPAGGVLIMNTDDDVSDVADFYREKFKGFKKKNEVNEDNQVILSSEGANVVIAPDDKKEGLTQIVVSIGGEDGMPGVPGGIPGGVPGGIPAPPEPPTAPGVAPPSPPGAKADKAPGATSDSAAPPSKADAAASKAKAQKKP